MKNNKSKDKFPAIDVPHHIGIIMDGNTRWATKHGYNNPIKGHEAGSDTLDKIIKHAAKRGVETVTVYAMSTENFKGRAKTEVKQLLNLLRIVLRRKIKMMKENGIALQFVGEMTVLPQSLKKLCKRAVKILKKNKRMKLNVALNYGGRDEIVRTVQKLIKNGIKADKINEELISRNLDTGAGSDVDLIIGTGRKGRLSNFLIWQSSYAEFYFTDTLWPDFNEEEFDKALIEYASRSRTMGVLHAMRSSEIN